MMASPKFLMPALAALLLSACGGASTETPLAGLAVAETVNGERVPGVLLDMIARERKFDLDVPEQRAKALSELTDYILLAQLAAKENYASDPAFAAEVEINRLQGVANATAAKLRTSATVDDSVLKVEYDQQIARAGSSEYDFSQLLFDSEDDALKAAGEAVAKPFNEVFDAWRAKAKQARSFSRVRVTQVPEALGKALAAMKSGDTTKVPFKTEFGWHVVHVGAVSPFTPPAFEQVKESIRATVLGQVVDQRLNKLRSEADVKVETPVVAPKPAPAAATTAPGK